MNKSIYAMVILIILGGLVATSPPVCAGNDDSNEREVMVEWIEDYSGTSWPNLDDQEEEALGFYNGLADLGWTKYAEFGNDAAYESDWEKSSVGGVDYSWVDATDFAYFTGHGTPNAFLFSLNMDGDGFYQNRVHHSEVYWGDKDLEWVCLGCCSCLKYEDAGGTDIWDRWGAYSRWGGLHGILGFAGTSYATGSSLTNKFVDYLAEPKTIADSWKRATKEDQWDTWAAYLSIDDAERDYMQNLLEYEYLTGEGRVGPDIDNPQSMGWNHWEC